MRDSHSYRGRIAPSPTGLLHAGHASTFRAAAERAAAAGGTLVLRMEDLDPQRSRREFVQAAIEDLQWLGLRWREGPDVGGPFGPYSQSERMPYYQAAWKRLHAEGLVYPCRCTRRDLAEAAQAPHQDEPIYPGTCRPAEKESLAATDLRLWHGTNWRFRVRDGDAVQFSDGCFGAQSFVCGQNFGDFLVWRKDGVPAYQLAVAVDDAEMEITEVVRGADLLQATARQILLCRALRLAEPAWHHRPLVLDQRGERLAKRNQAVSLRALRLAGVSPHEVVMRGPVPCALVD